MTNQRHRPFLVTAEYNTKVRYYVMAESKCEAEDIAANGPEGWENDVGYIKTTKVKKGRVDYKVRESKRKTKI